MSKTYETYTDKFANCTFEESIRLLRHDMGHQLLKVVGYSELFLTELADRPQEDLKNHHQALHKFAQETQAIFYAFTDLYLREEQE